MKKIYTIAALALVAALSWLFIPKPTEASSVRLLPNLPLVNFEGYVMAGEQPTTNAVTVLTNDVFVWANPTDDIRALQRPNRDDRMAACWYGETFDVDVNFNDELPHYISIYMVDFDRQGRSQLIEFLDPETGELLLSLVVDYQQLLTEGVYRSIEVIGHVLIRFSRIEGANAVMSAVFTASTLNEIPSPSASPTPTVAQTPTPSPTPTPCRKLPNGKCRKN